MFTATTSLIASHGDGWDHGPGPSLPLLIVGFWVAVAAFVAWRFRQVCGASWPGSDGRSVLAERYARGDISADEYRERRDVLGEKAR